MKIGKLYIGIRKTNEENNFILASWAYPRGYWRWALYLRRLPGFGFGYGPGMDSGKRYWVWKHFSAWLRIPWLGVLSLAIQPPAINPELWK